MDSFLSFVSDIFTDVVKGAFSIILATLIFACLYYCCKILQRWYKYAVINRVGHDQKQASKYIMTNRKKASKLQLFFLDQTGIMIDKDYIIGGLFGFLGSFVVYFFFANLEITGSLKKLIMAVYPVYMVLVLLFFVILFVWAIYSLIAKARIVPLIVLLLYFFLCFHELIV